MMAAAFWGFFCLDFMTSLTIGLLVAAVPLVCNVYEAEIDQFNQK